MKFKKGFVLRTIGGENTLVGEGIEQIDFNKLIILNQTAVIIWNNLKDKDFSTEDAVNVLLENYEVEREVAEKDVTELFRQLSKAGILE
ncbi:MAG: PqqD family protein [Candidatus Egerieousia sp.]